MEKINENNSEFNGLSKTEIRNKVTKEVYKEIAKQNRESFPKFAEDAVKEFEELGFELKFDFSDVVLK